MQARREYHGLLWIDLESPTQVEVKAVAEEFGIAAPIAEELLLPASKPRAELYDGYVYVVMHFPALKRTHTSRDQEVDFVIGRNFLITAHYETIDTLHKFSKVFEVNTTLETVPFGDHAGFLFFYMLKRLYKSIEHELDSIRRELQLIEEHIFSGHEVEMVNAISRSSRGLLNLRQTIEPHREVLHELEESGPRFFGEAFSPYLRSLSNEYYRVHNHITRATETLHELRATNDSLLTTKQNETMKVLTLLAFVTLPLSLVASIFEMNANDMPIVGNPHGFWIIIGIMAAMAFAMLLYFKHRKWL